jgi:hypothetical protein
MHNLSGDIRKKTYLCGIDSIVNAQKYKYNDEKAPFYNKSFDFAPLPVVCHGTGSGTGRMESLGRFCSHGGKRKSPFYGAYKQDDTHPVQQRFQV